jgi:hypothetical protein
MTEFGIPAPTGPNSIAQATGLGVVPIQHMQSPNGARLRLRDHAVVQPDAGEFRPVGADDVDAYG